MIDEADRILEVGFEEEMKQIVRLLPKSRQTLLFSATQTKKVEDLARLSIQGTPEYVAVERAARLPRPPPPPPSPDVPPVWRRARGQCAPVKLTVAVRNRGVVSFVSAQVHRRGR